MKHISTTLASGLRLVTVPVIGTKAVTVLVLVGAGSRYEVDRERGIAHFLEHMFFKGGIKFDTPHKVAETIDSIGGDFNAFTGKEYAGYYVKCAGEKKSVAFDVLSDMLLNTKLSPEDIEREKGVILEELNMYQDTPMYQIGWDYEHLMYGDTAMGRDQIGIPETIRSFTQQDFTQYKHDLYTADNTVIIVAGDITSVEAEDLTKHYFRFPDGKKKRSFEQHQSFSLDQQVQIRTKKTEQAHLVIGFPGYAFGHPDEITSRLLAIILGGGMSSRMFTEIREQRGLCYSISTSTDNYSDSGIISTHAGVDFSRSKEAVRAIAEEYITMAKNGPTSEEVTKAKNYLKGKLTLRLEDSEELASYFGVQAILVSETRTVEQLFQKIDNISLQDIARVAAESFQEQYCYLAAIGNFTENADADFKDLLKIS